MVFDEAVDKELRDACLDIERRYEVKFFEIGTDKDHIHSQLQSVPRYSVKKLATITKILTVLDLQALLTCKEEAMGRRVLNR